MLPAHTIATSPTKTSATSRFGLGGPASKRLRGTQSTRVPPSSQATNSLHMRSKSIPNESVRSRNHHGTHSQHHGHHQHDVHSRPHHNQRAHGDVTSSHKSAGKSRRFSLSSTLQSISRSLTTMCGRTRQGNPHQRRNDANESYIHI